MSIAGRFRQTISSRISSAKEAQIEKLIQRQLGDIDTAPNVEGLPSSDTGQLQSMSSTPRQVGTLVVVVLKANHLPNKRHIGKQAPYCVCSVEGEKRRTKSIHRGGQHPEWDEELRFMLREDVGDELARTASADDAAPPLPPKDSKTINKIKGKAMRLSCFADDPREPDLIGEVDVDLTEVLTKGETDEWFNLLYKGKFAGKVYLEMTFWSNEPAPEKKAAPQIPKPNKQYGGPGSFIAAGEGYPGASPNGYQPSGRSTSVYEHTRQRSESLSSSIASSGIMGGLDLYQAPYERSNAGVSSLINDFGVLNVAPPHRSDTYPPPLNGSFDQNGRPVSAFESNSSHMYNQPAASISQSSLHHSRSSLSGYGPSYHPSYENGQTASLTAPPAPGRSRMPQASSGFMPLPVAPSFLPVNESSTPPSHTPSPGGFAPQPAVTPAPGFPQQSQFGHPAYAPMPVQTPTPGGYAQPSYPQSQSYGYSQPQQYAMPASSVPPPTQSYMPPPSSISSGPTLSQGYGESGYYDQSIQPPLNENMTSQPPNMSNSLSASLGPGSRPLPQPAAYPTIPPTPYRQPSGSYSPNHLNTVPFSNNSPYQNVPPPPPLGPQDGAGGYFSSPSPTAGIPPPPPPPTLPQGSSLSAPVRRASLPPPPVANYAPSQQQGYPPPQPQQPPLLVPPPPPPPPLLQNGGGGINHPLPAPPPPASLGGGMPYPGPPPLPPPPMQAWANTWQAAP